MSADRTPAPVAVSVEIDSDDLRRHAELLADEGEHGPAHVLFTAAKHIEAGGDIPEWMGKPAAPRPEPVAAPLPTEAVEALAAVIRPHDGYPQHHTSACVCGRILVGDYAEHLAKNLIAAGYRLVPEDDEDMVRVPREAIERLRELLALYRDDPYAPTSAIADFLKALDGPL